MLQKRIDYFTNMPYEKRQELTEKDFTVSELYEIIEETALNDENKQIAILRFIKDETFLQIAQTVFLDIKTVQRRVPLISNKLKTTILKML